MEQRLSLWNLLRARNYLPQQAFQRDCQGEFAYMSFSLYVLPFELNLKVRLHCTSTFLPEHPESGSQHAAFK